MIGIGEDPNAEDGPDSAPVKKTAKNVDPYANKKYLAERRKLDMKNQLQIPDNTCFFRCAVCIRSRAFVLSATTVQKTDMYDQEVFSERWDSDITGTHKQPSHPSQLWKNWLAYRDYTKKCELGRREHDFAFAVRISVWRAEKFRGFHGAPYLSTVVRAEPAGTIPSNPCSPEDLRAYLRFHIIPRLAIVTHDKPMPLLPRNGQHCVLVTNKSVSGVIRGYNEGMWELPPPGEEEGLALIEVPTGRAASPTPPGTIDSRRDSPLTTMRVATTARGNEQLALIDAEYLAKHERLRELNRLAQEAERLEAERLAEQKAFDESPHWQVAAGMFSPGHGHFQLKPQQRSKAASRIPTSRTGNNAGRGNGDHLSDSDLSSEGGSGEYYYEEETDDSFDSGISCTDDDVSSGIEDSDESDGEFAPRSQRSQSRTGATSARRTAAASRAKTPKPALDNSDGAGGPAVAAPASDKAVVVNQGAVQVSATGDVTTVTLWEVDEAEEQDGEQGGDNDVQIPLGRGTPVVDGRGVDARAPHSLQTTAVVVEGVESINPTGAPSLSVPTQPDALGPGTSTPLTKKRLSKLRPKDSLPVPTLRTEGASTPLGPPSRQPKDLTTSTARSKAASTARSQVRIPPRSVKESSRVDTARSRPPEKTMADKVSDLEVIPLDEQPVDDPAAIAWRLYGEERDDMGTDGSQVVSCLDDVPNSRFGKWLRRAARMGHVELRMFQMGITSFVDLEFIIEPDLDKLSFSYVEKHRLWREMEALKERYGSFAAAEEPLSVPDTPQPFCSLNSPVTAEGQLLSDNEEKKAVAADGDAENASSFSQGGTPVLTRVGSFSEGHTNPLATAPGSPAATGEHQGSSLERALKRTGLLHKKQHLQSKNVRTEQDLVTAGGRSDQWLGSNLGLTPFEGRKIRTALTRKAVVYVSPKQIDLPVQLGRYEDTLVDVGDDGAGVRRSSTHGPKQLSSALVAVLSSLGRADELGKFQQVGVTRVDDLSKVTDADLEVIGLNEAEILEYREQVDTILVGQKRRERERLRAERIRNKQNVPLTEEELQQRDEQLKKKFLKQGRTCCTCFSWRKFVLFFRKCMPAPRVTPAFKPFSWKIRLHAFIRLTTPGLKPWFGRRVFWARAITWFCSLVSWCALASASGTLELKGEPPAKVTFNVDSNLSFVFAIAFLNWLWITLAYGYYGMVAAGKMPAWNLGHVVETALEMFMWLFTIIAVVLAYQGAAGFRLFPSFFQNALAAAVFLTFSFMSQTVSSLLLCCSGRFTAGGPSIGTYNVEDIEEPERVVVIETGGQGLPEKRVVDEDFVPT
jgi:hypothetical protein